MGSVEGGGGVAVEVQTLVADMKLLKEMKEHSGLLPFFFSYL